MNYIKLLETPEGLRENLKKIFEDIDKRLDDIENPQSESETGTPVEDEPVNNGEGEGE